MKEYSQEELDELEIEALNNELATKLVIDQIKKEYALFRELLNKYTEEFARNVYCHKTVSSIAIVYGDDLKKAVAALIMGVIMLQQENDNLKLQLNKG